ncbi:hypothetical protein BD626DRAFT_569538 [Schizophyllum amplum]|uniref:Uncharacterized protein n=1 Tax=Schizophyllum amplum TaxID=97359 RepID=A0A550CDV6_9AGAR|nr:hypothetical protein BD626DRAFT_569538 [Auriculariopsis ampla]
MSLPMDSSNFDSIVELLHGEQFIATHANWHHATLQDLFIRCRQTGKKSYGLLFVDMINLIQLVARYSSLEYEHKKHKNCGPPSFMQVCKMYLDHDDERADGVKFSLASASARKTILNKRKNTLQKMVGYGRRFAYLASGGTVYCLMLIAIKNLKSDIQDRTCADEIFWLANILRKPYSDEVCKDERTRDTVNHIREGVIPAINYMRHQLPLEFGAMVAPRFQQHHDLPDRVRADDILLSDKFFDSIPTLMLKGVPRNMTVWSDLRVPVPDEVPVIDMDLVTKRVILDHPGSSQPPALPSPSPQSTIPTTTQQLELDRQLVEHVPDEPDLDGVRVYKLPIDMTAPQNVERPYPTEDLKARKQWTEH